MKTKETRQPFPDRKISETFLDFADPLLLVLPTPAAKREYEQILQIAFVVWNAVVYADAVGDDTHLKEVRRLMGGDATSRLITEQLIGRKRALFGADHRLVGEHKVTRQDGGFKLWAEARSPYPEDEDKAEQSAAPLPPAPAGPSEGAR